MVSFKHLLLAGLSFSEVIPKRIKSGDGRVQFDLICSAAECSQVKKALFAAGECLDNVIEIKEPLVISVKYYDFCKGKEACWSGTVGYTRHSDVEMGGEYSKHFYPQALVKQLGSEKMISGRIHQYDMVIDLNAGHEFQFPGNVKFTQQQVSLTSVISHEMLHGLGIASFFEQLDANQNLVMPRYQRDPKGNMQFIQNVFDSHLYIRATGQPLSSIIDKLDSLPSITENHTKLLQPPYIEAIQELSTLLTTNGSVYFLTSNHNKVDIETGYTDYQPGSSVSHLDGAYVDKIESMMIPHTTSGKGIDSMSKYRGWYIAPYGPLTLEILATLGYTLKKPTWGHSLGGIIQLIRQRKEKIRHKRKATSIK